MTGYISDPEGLIALAHDKSEDGRATLVTAITDLYAAGQEDLTDRDRALIDHILRDLVRDDPVTGLMNTTAFREVLEHDWAVAAREELRRRAACQREREQKGCLR